MRTRTEAHGTGRRPARRIGVVRVMLAAIALTCTLPAAADARWTQSEFIIGGWLPGNAEDRSRYLALDRAGLNLVINGDNYDKREGLLTAGILDSLRRARSGFGLKALVFYSHPQQRGSIGYNRFVDENLDSIRVQLDPSGGLNNPSVEGWVTWDEPRTPEAFRNIRAVAKFASSYPPSRDKLMFVNLFPSHAMWATKDLGCGDPKGPNAYRCYFDRYFQSYDGLTIPPPVVSLDHYVFQIARLMPDYFFSLEVMRQKAAQYSRPDYSIPMWLCVQLSDCRSGDQMYPQPSMSQVSWNAYTALAYGVKGLLYFTLAPMKSQEFGAGLFDNKGRLTSRLDSLTVLNRRLRELGPLLMGADPVGVIHQSAMGYDRIDSTLLAHPSRDRSVVKNFSGGGGQGMVGVLKNRAKPGALLLVVNKDLSTPRAFTLQLMKRATRVERISQLDGTTTTVAQGADQFDVAALKPGEGELFQIVP